MDLFDRTNALLIEIVVTRAVCNISVFEDSIEK